MSNIGTVLVVGAGPTGMTAAMELSRLGIPVRLVEKTAKPATTSRAVGVQARTLELFEQRGARHSWSGAGIKALPSAPMAAESASSGWSSRASTASTNTSCLSLRRRRRQRFATPLGRPASRSSGRPA
jgi:2-polyprenyl-6-methoxyphenol hydroxylase-like FAD-dependent oxidoreductase